MSTIKHWLLKRYAKDPDIYLLTYQDYFRVYMDEYKNNKMEK